MLPKFYVKYVDKIESESFRDIIGLCELCQETVPLRPIYFKIYVVGSTFVYQKFLTLLHELIVEPFFLYTNFKYLIFARKRDRTQRAWIKAYKWVHLPILTGCRPSSDWNLHRWIRTGNGYVKNK